MRFTRRGRCRFRGSALRDDGHGSDRGLRGGFRLEPDAQRLVRDSDAPRDRRHLRAGLDPTLGVRDGVVTHALRVSALSRRLALGRRLDAAADALERLHRAPPSGEGYDGSGGHFPLDGVARPRTVEEKLLSRELATQRGLMVNDNADSQVIEHTPRERLRSSGSTSGLGRLRSSTWRASSPGPSGIQTPIARFPSSSCSTSCRRYRRRVHVSRTGTSHAKRRAGLNSSTTFFREIPFDMVVRSSTAITSSGMARGCSDSLWRRHLLNHVAPPQIER